jgi:YesN/AraC family two-component response regulator
VELAEQGPEKILNPSMQLNDAPPSEQSEVKLERLLRYIDSHYHEDIELDDLAEHLHISRSSVQRIFKKQFLASFSEHLTQYRIGKACERLVNTDQPVAIISDAVGYTNLSNFNRQFKKIKHMTPTAFREVFRSPTS